jgi:hypothetical protein
MSTADTTTEAFPKCRPGQRRRPARLRADPAASPRSRAEQEWVLRRSRRAAALLGHGRHLPVGVADYFGR